MMRGDEMDSQAYGGRQEAYAEIARMVDEAGDGPFEIRLLKSRKPIDFESDFHPALRERIRHTAAHANIANNAYYIDLQELLADITRAEAKEFLRCLLDTQDWFTVRHAGKEAYYQE
jgi:hypothetical protein